MKKLFLAIPLVALLCGGVYDAFGSVEPTQGGVSTSRPNTPPQNGNLKELTKFYRDALDNIANPFTNTNKKSFFC